jgi:hypothetical protein
MIIKEPNNKNWIIFTLFSLMAAYTHYYATIATGTIYLLLISYLLIKDRILLKKWFLFTIIAILSYLPWGIMFIIYSGYFGNSVWWTQPTFQSINDVISCIFSPVNTIDDYTLNDLGKLLFIFIVILLIFYTILSMFKKDERKTLILWGGIFVLISTMSFATIFSYLINQCFIKDML